MKKIFYISLLASALTGFGKDVSKWSDIPNVTDGIARLTANISVDKSITVSKDIVIDGNGKSITRSSSQRTYSMTIAKGCKVTIGNFTFTSNLGTSSRYTGNPFITLSENSILEIGNGVVISGSYGSGSTGAINAKAGTIRISGNPRIIDNGSKNIVVSDNEQIVVTGDFNGSVGVSYPSSNAENGQFGKVLRNLDPSTITVSGFVYDGDNRIKGHVAKDGALVWINHLNVGKDSWNERWFDSSRFYINNHENVNDSTIRLSIDPALNVYGVEDIFWTNAVFASKNGTTIPNTTSATENRTNVSVAKTVQPRWDSTWLNMNISAGNPDRSLWKLKLGGIEEKEISRRYYRFIFKATEGYDSDGVHTNFGILQINQLELLSGTKSLVPDRGIALNRTSSYPVQLNPGEVTLFLHGEQIYDNPIGTESPDQMFMHQDYTNQPGSKTQSGCKLCVTQNNLYSPDGTPADSNNWVTVVFCFPSDIVDPITGYRFKTANDNTPARNPAAWSFEGSRDGVNWQLLDEREKQNGPTKTLSWSDEYKVSEGDIDYNVFVSGNTANTFGMVKVESATTNTMIAVPWTWHSIQFADAKAIPVDKLVRPTNLSNGDFILFSDTDGSSYLTWVLENGRWSATPTVRIGANMIGSIHLGSDSSGNSRISRGNSMWLCRKDASKPFYLFGQFTDTKVYDIIYAPTNGATVCSTALGNPGMEETRLNDLEFDGTIDKTDRIWFYDQDGVIRDLTYVAGKGWRRARTMTVDGRVVTVYDYDTTIPAGIGFWYDRRGKENMTIRWSKKN